MSMVVGDGEHCACCGKEIDNKSRVDVHVKFRIKPYEMEHYGTIAIDSEDFNITFCSLPCMINFDWKQLQTRENWAEAHNNFEPPTP